jgi:hypothetical protein
MSALPKFTHFDIAERMPRHPRIDTEGLLYRVMARRQRRANDIPTENDYEAKGDKEISGPRY